MSHEPAAQLTAFIGCAIEMKVHGFITEQAPHRSDDASRVDSVNMDELLPELVFQHCPIFVREPIKTLGSKSFLRYLIDMSEAYGVGRILCHPGFCTSTDGAWIIPAVVGCHPPY